MDPATQLALVAGIIGAVMAVIAMGNTALMFWLNSVKERRADQRAEASEKRADERELAKVRATEMVAQKVEEAKQANAVICRESNEIKAAGTEATIQAISVQTEELKHAISNGNGGGLAKVDDCPVRHEAHEVSSGRKKIKVVEAPVTVVAPEDKKS